MNRQRLPVETGLRSARLVGVVLLMLWLIGVSTQVWAERFPEDPVELFKQALQLENDKLRYKPLLDEDEVGLKLALEFRRRNLEKAAANLKTSSDLARALVLLWPRPPKNKSELDAETQYDRGARAVERKIRDEMIVRFMKHVQTSLKDNALTPEAGLRQIATANVVSETVVASANDPLDVLQVALYDKLQPLSKDLAQQVSSRQFRVREAIARALGQFPKSPKIAAEALRQLLDPSNPESTRRAAAEALGTLALNVSTSQPIRGTEPGVAVREARRTARIFDLEEVVALVSHVVTAAPAGFQDSSLPVRRQAVLASRLSAEAMAFEVRAMLPTSPKDVDLPPIERRGTKEKPGWSPTEINRVAERDKETREKMKTVTPALRAFRDQGQALLRASRDSDPTVRMHARRTLDTLGQIRDLILKLRETIPGLPGDAKGMSQRFTRGSILTVSATEETRPPVPRLPVPTSPVARRQEKDKAKEVDADKDPDPLGTLLHQVGEGLLPGLREKDRASRRAAHEALESLGTGAIPFIPHLIPSLKDDDLFVRWITARTLGKLAPAGAADSVPALTNMLKDPDLDARIAATKALGQFGPSASSAVPSLAAGLARGDADFRVNAMKALEAIGTEAKPALPALAASLSDVDPRVRAEAARIMGRFGPLAIDHLDALRKRSTDPDSDVRKSVSSAILAILGER